MTSSSTSDFAHLRYASAEVLALIQGLRQGEQLPLDPTPKYAEALRLWAIERSIVLQWAAEVRRGTRRRRCSLVNAWSAIVRKRFGVESAYERSNP